MLALWSGLGTNLQECTGSWIKGLLVLWCHRFWAVNTEQREISWSISVSPHSCTTTQTPRRLSRHSVLPLTPFQEGQFSMDKPKRECQAAAHPLQHSCWPAAPRHKGFPGHQLRAPCSKHHQELLTFGESFWPHDPHLLSILPENNTHHLLRGEQSTATQRSQNTWLHRTLHHEQFSSFANYTTNNIPEKAHPYARLFQGCHWINQSEPENTTCKVHYWTRQNR